MSRLMPSANAETYRVTVITDYPTGRTYRRTYGPFATASAAKSTRTRETKIALNGSNENVVSAVIERAELNWEEVRI